MIERRMLGFGALAMTRSGQTLTRRSSWSRLNF